MSSISVTVLTPHGRRPNVQVVPHMTLLQILEEVCKKYDFQSEEYCLKHHNKELDLTQMFRFSGLPNKCLLEMDECKRKREDTEVVICIQLENGIRHQDQFHPNQTLKDVLEKLSPTSFDGNPVIVYMRAEIYGDQLEKTTLKSLGITKGKAMLRVLNKNPEDLKNQASVYVPPTKVITSSIAKNESKIEFESKRKNDSNDNETNKINEKKITSDIIRNLKTKKEEKVIEPMEVEEDESNKNETNTKKIEYDWGTSVGRTMNDKIVQSTNNDENEDENIEEPEIFELGERNAVVFSINTAQKVTDDIPDSFFDLTVDDLKVLLRDLKKEATGNDDAPLLTAKLRELEESNRTLRKLGQYKRSVIRIQFPDRMVLQGTFSPTDKIEDVYDFVRNYLKNPNSNFYLFTIPPKRILDRTLTLIEADCIPTAVLHFGIEESDEMENKQQQPENFLKDGLQQTSANGATLAASKSRGLMYQKHQHKQQQEQQQLGLQDENKAGPSNQQTPLACTGAIPKQPKQEFSKKPSTMTESAGKIPKWFKPLKK